MSPYNLPPQMFRPTRLRCAYDDCNEPGTMMVRSTTGRVFWVCKAHHDRIGSPTLPHSVGYTVDMEGDARINVDDLKAAAGPAPPVTPRPTLGPVVYHRGIASGWLLPFVCGLGFAVLLALVIWWRW